LKDKFKFGKVVKMAGKDQSIGALILVVCILGIIIYGYLVFFSSWNLIVLQLTGFVAIAGILGIGAWIGWTMATTPPPVPIEELEKEEDEITEEKKEKEDTKE
jgi:predicted DNA-binding transcriptional regulator